MPDALDLLIDQHGPAVVCAALAPMLSEERRARLDAVLAARLGSVTAVVEDVYDPHNGAAAIRSSEGLGLQEFHAVETINRFHANDGVTRGCHRWIDIHRWSNVAACAGALRERGFTVLATLPGAPVDLETVDVGAPVALVFGNEHAGLSEEAIAACDGGISIAMYGFSQSFNLSVSVALAMSRVATRRRAHLGRTGDLDPARIDHLRARWYALKIRGATGVIERFVAAGTHPDVAPGPQSRENR